LEHEGLSLGQISLAFPESAERFENEWLANDSLLEIAQVVVKRANPK
jgi:hypothetical protein